MLHWTPYIFVRWVCFLILGIVLQLFLNLDTIPWIVGGLLAWITFTMCCYSFSAKQHRQYATILGLLAVTFLIAVGGLRTHQYTAKNDPLHFIHLDSIEAYQAKIISQVQPRAKSYRAELVIKKVLHKGTWQTSKGRVMVYFRKQENTRLDSTIGYGSVLLVRGTPQLLEPPKNPQGFDYQAYLYYQNTYHQHFLAPENYQVMGKSLTIGEHFIDFSYELREQGLAILTTHLTQKPALATASALLLGVKDYIDDELRTAYSGSGLMHLLAVSGLHVGLIMVLLNSLFAPLKKNKRWGKYLFLVLVVGFLCIYAFVTGLSPSVMRAVLMFSLVLLATTFGRRGLIYNNIALSAFILLVFNPFLIASVSFQLSYLAVLGIVYIQPKIYRWFTVKNYVLHKAWELTTVSIAAQIGTAPLAIYYFHQFPNYFILANLLVLPMAFPVLGIGIALLFLGKIPLLGDGIGFVFEQLISAVNLLAALIQKLPGAVSAGLYLNRWEVLYLYVFLIFFLMLWAYRKLYYLAGAVFVLFLFQISYSTRYFQNQKQQSLVIFHTPRTAQINLMLGKESHLILKDSTLLEDPSMVNFNLVPYWQYKGISKNYTYLQTATINASFAYRNFDKWSFLYFDKKLWLLISQRLYEEDLAILRDCQPDFVVLQNNALYLLEPLAQTLKIPYLIVDASNGYYRSKAIAAEAKTQGISCWSIHEKGAFLYERKLNGIK